MPVKIVRDNYGKSRVRLLKVARSGGRHEVQNLTLNIALEGDFEAIHTAGDNTLCLPTDTMKNTVYALAGQVQEIETAEAFGRRLATHFIDTNTQVSRVAIDIAETVWKRMKFDGERHSHSFLKCGGEIRIATISADREGITVESGV